MAFSAPANTPCPRGLGWIRCTAYPSSSKRWIPHLRNRSKRRGLGSVADGQVHARGEVHRRPGEVCRRSRRVTGRILDCISRAAVRRSSSSPRKTRPRGGRCATAPACSIPSIRVWMPLPASAASCWAAPRPAPSLHQIRDVRYPVELKFVKPRELWQSIARGYDSQCFGPQGRRPGRRLRPAAPALCAHLDAREIHRDVQPFQQPGRACRRPAFAGGV